MTRDEKVTRLIQLLKEENPGYAVIQIPDGAEERRRLLRSLMNVRWPGEASPEYLGLQDELLQEEAREKGIVQPEELPAVWETFPEAELRNGGPDCPLAGRHHPACGGRHCQCGQQPAAGVFCSLPRLYRQCHPFRGRDPAPQRMRPDHGRRRPGRENRTGQDHSRL